MPSARSMASPAFAHREFNGEVLLDELADLRAARLSQAQLNEVATALRALRDSKPAPATAALRQLAQTRFSRPERLAELLLHWGQRLRTEADVEAVVGHFRRLALTGALLTAVRRGADRLAGGRR
jgi:hypothetical protein